MELRIPMVTCGENFKSNGRAFQDISGWLSVMTTNLRSARKRGLLEKFIKEHEADPKGDLDKLDEVIKKPVRGTGKEVPPASSQDASDD